MSKAERTAVIGIVVAAVLGAIMAIAGSDGGDQLGGDGIRVFALLTIIAFAINIIAFIPSFLAKTEHYYDLTGSITYITVTLLALALAETLDTRSVIAGIMVLVWAGRLGTFLFRRVKKAGKDGRFDKIKQGFLRFLRFLQSCKQK